MDITISEILQGTTPGRMQSAGYMQLIPLCSTEDLIDKRFGPFTSLLSSTSNYGTLHLENRTTAPTIFPMGAGVLTKSAAQNHAIGKLKLMGQMSEARMDHAACIQESQGGYVSRGEHEITILPYSIRERALSIKDKEGYSKLWPAIREFNKNLGLQNMGHLEYYLEKFGDNLDEFIGQFEVVPNQVGAIVILNGQIAGVERAPNYDFWKELWKPLIRECYGSASLMFGQKGTKPSPPLGRMPINDQSVNSIETLESAYNEAESFEEDTVKQLVRNFIQKPFTCEREEKDSTTGLEVDHLTGGQFTGQIVRDSSFVVYASLIPDQRARFNTAANFSI